VQLYAHSGTLLFDLDGHEDFAGRAATCVSFSPDGKRLVSGGMDGKVRSWDTATGQCVSVHSFATDGALALCVSPSNIVAVALLHEARIQLVRLDDGALVKSVVAHYPRAMRFAGKEELFFLNFTNVEARLTLYHVVA